MARAQVTKAGAVLAATALAWLAASHFSHESATLELQRASMELLLQQQQQTLQLLQRQSGQGGALHNAQAPAAVTVATGGPTEGAAVAAGCKFGSSDACLAAALPGLSLPMVNADRVIEYTSAGSGTVTTCGGSYGLPELIGLFEPFCMDWVKLGREVG